MSRAAPGSLRWWQDTVLITLGGVALAIWLWDGPIVETTWVPIDAPAPPAPQAPRSLGDMLDAGCLTQEHLRAMAEGQTVTVFCPAPDGPPENRLFP